MILRPNTQEMGLAALEPLGGHCTGLSHCVCARSCYDAVCCCGGSNDTSGPLEPRDSVVVVVVGDGVTVI